MGVILLENIFDIKKEQALNFVLPKMYQFDKAEACSGDSVLLIHIYYVEKIFIYVEYIKNIPESIDIIFTVSSNETERVLREQLNDLKHEYKVIHKENRGRDVSALLVAARKELMKYKYIGFIHDKKERNELIKEDTNIWNYCLWENMLGSMSYINNVITTLKRDKGLGILVPPIPITRYLDYGYRNKWTLNFENVKKLVQYLSVRCDLDKEKPPIALGTVFWAKKEAIIKLFQYKWQYSDFDSEPLEDDGTISHAIERVLPFIAQDAGYYTGWVMTDEYASQRIENQYHIIRDVYHLLRKFGRIQYIFQVDEWLKYETQLLDFCKRYNEVYIYGTGNNGIECFKCLDRNGIVPAGFLVTSKKYKESEKLFEVVIQTYDDFVSGVFIQKVGIILAVQEKYQRDIFKYISYAGVNEQNIFIWRNIWM